jgi:hypothetical protein
MTKHFAGTRRFSIIASLTVAVVTGLLGAFALGAPHAAAQDVGLEECGFACGIVTGSGDGSILVAPPLFPDLASPDDIDAIYAVPPPTPPPPTPDPYSVDTDGDGIPDGYEGIDSDNDGVWDWHEIYIYGTDPYTADQPMHSGGGGELEPPNEITDEECTYVTPDTCFPRVKPDDDTPE